MKKYISLLLLLLGAFLVINSCKKDTPASTGTGTTNTPYVNPNAPVISILLNPASVNAGDKVFVTMHAIAKKKAKIVHLIVLDNINGVTINVKDSIFTDSNVVMPFYYVPYATGLHTMKLIATDDAGLTDSITKPLTVVGTSIGGAYIHANNNGSIITGRSANFSISAIDGAFIKHMKITYTMPSGTAPVTLMDTPVFSINTNFYWNYYTQPLNIIGTYTFTFIVTDGNGVISQATAYQDVTADFIEYDGLTLGAQNNYLHGHMLQYDGNIVYLTANTAGYMGIAVYAYDATSGSILASPTWSGLMSIYSFYADDPTSFKVTVSPVDFSALNSTSDLQKAYNSRGRATDAVSFSAKGTVIPFKDAWDKYGAIQIVDIGSGSSGYITVNVKKQR